MKIVSTNLAIPGFIEWKGSQRATGIFKHSVEGPLELTKTGVTGDFIAETKVHGGVEMACYLYSSDHYDFWKTKYANFKEEEWHWGMFGENLTIEGFKEDKIQIGDQLIIGDNEVILEISQPRTPCFKLGARFGTQKMIKDFLNAGYCGAYVRVIKEGSVVPGAEVQIKPINSESITLSEAFSLLKKDANDEPLREKAKNLEILSNGYRKNL